VKGAGGRDVKDAIRNALVKILTDDVAKELNWCGAKRQDRTQKKPFGETEIQLAFFRK